MRILVITTAHHPRYDCQGLLYEYFAEQPDTEVTVVAPSSTDVTRGSVRLPEREDYGRVHVRRIYRDIPEMWNAPEAKAQQFRRTVRQAKPEVIWCWHENNYPLAAYAHEISGAPIVLLLECPSEKILKRARQDKVPVVLSCVRTHRQVEEAMSWGGQYFLQVNAPAGVPNAPSYWKDRKLNRGIFVGSLGYGYKDPERFVALLPELFERTPMERFLLISSGSDVPRRILEEYGDKYPIDYRQHATREEIFEEIAKSMFSFTTMRGDWPGAFPCESWALKTPVFAAGGTMGGMIRDGVTGVISFEGVRRLYEDPPFYRRIQEEAYRAYEKEYATEAVGQRCYRIFRALLEGNLKETWEELRWKNPECQGSGEECQKKAQKRKVVVSFVPTGVKRLRIGIQIPKAGTFDGIVWGDEILAEGIADALNQFDIVETATVYTPVTIHSNLDLVVSFYPHPEMLFVPEAANIWWFQAGLLRAEDLEQIHIALSLYDDILAAGRKPLLWLRQQGVDHVDLMPMGADLSIYRPHKPEPRYAHEIVFVGNNNRTPEQIEQYLIPLVPLGLRIYGSGWETVPELKPALMGTIHPREVPKLYSSAKIVLSLHTAWHREMDVPTTRLWEATACGAVVVSDPLPLAQTIFADAIVWSAGGRELVENVKTLLRDNNLRGKLRAKARLHALKTGGFSRQAILLLSRYAAIADPEKRTARRIERLLNRGRNLFERGELRKAEQCFHTVLALQPDSAEGHNDLGAVLWQRGERRAALDHFRAAVKLDPYHGDALTNFVAACHEMGAYPLLERIMNELVAQQPTRTELLPILADVLIRQGRTERATEVLERCVRLDPGNAEARIVLEALRDGNKGRIVTSVTA